CRASEALAVRTCWRGPGGSFRTVKTTHRTTISQDNTEYLCGVRLGERVRLLRRFILRDHEGRPTRETHLPGEVWTVIAPSSAPEFRWRVLLHEPGGELHAWHDSKKKFWGWFERMDEDSV
ncbi:MAG TPA: hypothetical protein VHI52_04965, partial [Verrucomicrobiae bacterium]|nr:hypothetical protein [Verrucomicrobiae bacterium]